jgi:hypothetical protein
MSTDDRDAPDDVLVELAELFCEDPQLFVLAPTHDVTFGTSNAKVVHLEPCDVAGERAALRVPVAYDLPGVAEIEYRVEDRLLR